jgi:PilZ domain-containing protein
MRKEPIDKRKRRRFSYVLDAGKETRDLGTARIKDISPGGASIECADPPPAGTFLEVEFKIRCIPIEIGAEIVWSVPDKGVGVRFHDLTPGNVALISDSLEDVVLVDAREAGRALACGRS